eukprot:6046308-Prymnesium_polylepis.2
MSFTVVKSKMSVGGNSMPVTAARFRAKATAVSDSKPTSNSAVSKFISVPPVSSAISPMTTFTNSVLVTWVTFFCTLWMWGAA